MITKDQQEILAEIFTESERPDKMDITFDAFTKTVTITYEDLDEEWWFDLTKKS